MNSVHGSGCRSEQSRPQQQKKEFILPASPISHSGSSFSNPQTKQGLKTIQIDPSFDLSGFILSGIHPAYFSQAALLFRAVGLFRDCHLNQIFARSGMYVIVPECLSMLNIQNYQQTPGGLLLIGKCRQQPLTGSSDWVGNWVGNCSRRWGVLSRTWPTMTLLF